MKKKAEAEPEDPLASGFGYLGELLETTNERLQTIIELLQELKGAAPPPPPQPAGAPAQGRGGKKSGLSEMAKKLEEQGQGKEEKPE